jgi:excisionase family DNA binding protein
LRIFPLFILIPHSTEERKLKKNTHDLPRLMTIQNAALYIGLSIATLRRMDKKGVLVPFRTPGGHRRYSRQMLDEYLEDSRGQVHNNRGQQ